MKTLLFILTLSLSQFASAALYDRGNGLIYDDDLDITWLQDANYAATSGYDVDGEMTWFDAVDWADQLTFSGYASWQLPTQSQMEHLHYSELGAPLICA